MVLTFSLLLITSTEPFDLGLNLLTAQALLMAGSLVSLLDTLRRAA